MGAVAPIPHWIPEDDALLRNSEQAGASLESLAKGAVQFSRRFTVQELQDRWRSLLYDPVVSEEASAYMIELEQSAATYLSRYKSESVKERKSSSGKRKAETIRQCYYRMRKRICIEPFDMMDTSVLSELGNSNLEIRKHLRISSLAIQFQIILEFKAKTVTPVIVPSQNLRLVLLSQLAMRLPPPSILVKIKVKIFMLVGKTCLTAFVTIMKRIYLSLGFTMRFLNLANQKNCQFLTCSKLRVWKMQEILVQNLVAHHFVISGIHLLYLKCQFGETFLLPVCLFN